MNQDPAKSRWIAIQLIRLTGVAMAVLGLVVLGGRIDWPPITGYILAAAGLFDAMVVPRLLARRWKSPPE